MEKIHYSLQDDLSELLPRTLAWQIQMLLHRLFQQCKDANILEDPNATLYW